LCLSILAFFLIGVCSADETPAVQEPGESMLLFNVHMWHGQDQLGRGNLEEAAEHFLLASRYMRDSPEPHFALAKVYQGGSFMDAFLEFATGIQLLLTDFFYQSLLVSNLALLALVSAGFSIYAATAAVTLRHARAVRYSVMISIAPALRGWSPNMVIIGSVLAFVIVLSSLSIIGIVTWTLAAGAAFTWRFASSSERRVFVGFAVFLAVFGFLLNFSTRILSTQHPESPLRLAAMMGRIEGDRLAESMQSDEISPRFDPIREFMLGLTHLKNGRYGLAIQRFELASKFDPDNTAILNNIGIAYHGLGRYDQAASKFRSALKRGAREAVIHYNYAQSLNALLQYDLAQVELEKASTLDFDLTRALVTRSEASALVPMNLQNRVLWRLALDRENQAVASGYHPVEAAFAGKAVLVILVVAILVLMRKSKIPARCDICAATVQWQISRRKRKEILCTACQEIKDRNADDHNLMEEELESRIVKRDRGEVIKRIVLGLILPGTAYCLSGKRAKGLIVSFVVFSFLLLALGGGALIKPVPNMGSQLDSGWAIFAFVVVYGLCCWRSIVLTMRSLEER
jgi:tetratricopeptide (TPR) repeat protein